MATTGLWARVSDLVWQQSTEQRDAASQRAVDEYARTHSPVFTETPIPSDVTQRIADVYMSTFGKAVSDQGAVAVVPVGPQNGGGGGISVGTILLLVALGVGGWFVYKKVRKAE